MSVTGYYRTFTIYLVVYLFLPIILDNFFSCKY